MSEETKEVEDVEVAEPETAELNFETLVSEEVSPLYFNQNLIQPPFKLYRINSSGGRIYFTFEDEERFLNPTLFMGTGSVTSQMPTNRQLQKYIADKGWYASEHEKQLWGLYGSYSDSRIAEYVQYGKFDGGLQALPERIKEYYALQNFILDDYELYQVQRCIGMDMLGFQAFVKDRNVEFAFVELGVRSFVDGVATPIDFGCFFDTEFSVDGFKLNGEKKKNKVKEVRRVFGLFNYKSGKIHKQYGVQSCLERTMFMETFPEFTDLPIRSYNLTIKDFRNMNWNKYRATSDTGKPYSIKDWTDSGDEQRALHYLELAKLETEAKVNRKISIISGDMRMTDDPTQFVVTKTIKQIIEDGSWLKYSKTNSFLEDAIKTTV